MSDERAQQVLAGMESGASMRKACEAAGLPASTFIDWCDADPALAEQYARARQRMLDLKADELEDIGERAANEESPAKIAGLRLLSDNRKWLLSKLAPKKYGDKLELSGNKDAPLTVQVVRMSNGDDPAAS